VTYHPRYNALFIIADLRVTFLSLAERALAGISIAQAVRKALQQHITLLRHWSEKADLYAHVDILLQGHKLSRHGGIS